MNVKEAIAAANEGEHEGLLGFYPMAARILRDAYLDERSRILAIIEAQEPQTAVLKRLAAQIRGEKV